jgi:pimeloyl-ACP methyl ester carboxylesterase
MMPNLSLTFFKAWNTGPLFSDSCGFIALSHPPSPARLIVAFRGTYSIANTIADLSTVPQEYVPYPGDGEQDGHRGAECKNCSIHMGFYTSWQNTRNEILPYVESTMRAHPDYSLTLVGHSLGGAVAGLAGLELLSRGYSPTVTTFGEPRVGNQGMADYIDERFNLSRRMAFGVHRKHQSFRRVTHMSDPVPLLPLEEWGYEPHGGEIFIFKSDLPPNTTDIYHCSGTRDDACSAGAQGDWERFPWGLPTRFKMWQLLFAHRDYFWRLGLCVPESKWWLWQQDKS